MTLADRMVVMTGGAGGIARATVEMLLADGAYLHLIDPDEGGLQRIVTEMDARDRITTAASAIDSPEACEAALEHVTRPIYGLIHLAGVFIVDDLDAASRPIWNDVIAANLTNAFDNRCQLKIAVFNRLFNLIPEEMNSDIGKFSIGCPPLLKPIQCLRAKSLLPGMISGNPPSRRLRIKKMTPIPVLFKIRNRSSGLLG